jgi:iron complex transport system ATP-binding protein
VVIALVSHHLEEIPAGFAHALVLDGGQLVASGPIADVVTDEVLSSAYGVPLRVASEDGRWTARMEPR